MQSTGGTEGQSGWGNWVLRVRSQLPGAVGQSRDVLDGAGRTARAAGETLMLHSPGERGREQTARNPGTRCVLIRRNSQGRMVP